MSAGADTVLELFDEYAAAYAAGERPDVLAFLQRAGAGADRLERLVDAYLQSAPLQPADELEAALLEARAEDLPALFVLRRRLRVGLDVLVERLTEALALAPAARPHLARRYQQLELGTLQPEGVSERVWSALRAVLGVDARSLAATPPQSVAAQAFARLARSAAADAALSQASFSLPAPPAPLGPAPAEPSADEAEVDRLFGAG